jgi:hypothetical protein
MIAILLIVYCLFYFNTIQAQSETTTGSSKSSFWKISGSYLTNSVYYGRQDSLLTPYLTPTLGYYDKSGFYISGSLSFLMTKNSSGIDLSSLDLGYEFAASDKFSGVVYANKSWYNQSSSNIKSDIKGNLGSYLSFDLNFVQLNSGIDFTFATKTDIGLNLGLSHSFLFGDEDHLYSLEPSFTTYWSTLHSYEGYINRKIKKRPGITLPAASVTGVTSVQNNKMTLLDYEISIPLSYETKKFGFLLTPTFAIPKNPIFTTTTITTTLSGGAGGGQSTQTLNSTPLSEKNLTNNFYADLTFFLKF